MATLARTVRFAVNPAGTAADGADDRNGYAGVPAMRGLGRFYAVQVVCAGEPDPVTGYIVNIKDIDRAVRLAVVPRIAAACEERPQTEPGTLLADLLPPLDAALAGCVRAMRWYLSPYYSVEMAKAEPGVVLIRQRFEFAAAHRLHVASLSDEANRAAFGKCNNPRGHGHNYRIEPCVAVPLRDGHLSLTLPRLERLVDETLIRRFDHKHLDEDTPEFARSGEHATTSSVENIARVFYGLLAPAVRAAAPDAELRSLTVWETDRTSSTYPG